MSKSSRKRGSRKAAIDKPPKPSPDFPLCAANCGAWQKKINGKIHYFGKWGRVVNGKLTRIQPDGCWQAALEEYKRQYENILLYGEPSVKGEGLTVRELCNHFYTAKKRLMESGDIAARTFLEYRGTTDRLVAAFGKERQVAQLGPADFDRLRAEIAKQWGPIRLGNEIQRVRTIFKYALDCELIDKTARFGPGFKKPSRKVLRLNRAGRAKRLFTAVEIRSLLDKAGPQLKAMILLGVNCGFGNADCAALPQSEIKDGWIAFQRPKTGIDRRCPLWPETVAALREAIATRPEPKDPAHTGLIFITKYGHRWVRTQTKKKDKEEQTTVDSVSLEFGKVLRAPKINGRKGLGFYSLRHTFRTIADATKDFPAIRLVMGHVDSSIDDTYREGIDDARLLAVTEYVRKWLFGDRV